MTSQAQKPPRIADMKHRLDLQSRSEASDNSGGQTYSWTTVSTVWAKVEPLSYNQQAYMEQFQGRVTHRVVTRYHSDWSTYWDWINTSVSVPAGKEHRKNPQMRFSFKGRLLDIKTAQRYDEVNGFLEFYCEEKQ